MEKVKITLSVAIAVYNEEEKLAGCLSSVKGLADEIVVVDGGSTDRTVVIARGFGAKIAETDNPPVFHINKEKALSACRGAWILQLDADEVVTDALKEEIVTLIAESPKENGWYIPRKNFFLGHWMRKGGQYPDYVIRLVRRGKAHFPSKRVHEQIAVDGYTGYLKEPLLHNTFNSVAEYWKKARSYISLSAAEMKERKLPKNMANYFYYNSIKPLFIFFLLFLRHKGFMDGYVGFLFALFSALQYPLAYAKYLRED